MTNSSKDIVLSWLEIVQQGLKWSGSVDSVVGEDLTWTLIGSSPVSGTHRGMEAFQRDFLKRCYEGDGRGGGMQGLDVEAGRTLHIDRVTALEDGRVLAELRAEGVGNNGVPYNQQYCWIITVRNGKIRELIEFCDTALIERVMFDKVLVPAEEA